MQTYFIVADTTKKICELEKKLVSLKTSLSLKVEVCYDGDDTDTEDRLNKINELSKEIDLLEYEINDLENTLKSDYIKEVDGFVIRPITRKEYYERGTDDSLVPSWDFKGTWMYLELSDCFYIKIDVTKIKSDDLAELEICELAASIMLNF
jgi:hypothetical protein